MLVVPRQKNECLYKHLRGHLLGWQGDVEGHLLGWLALLTKEGKMINIVLKMNKEGL